jgi:hypothetical protein
MKSAPQLIIYTLLLLKETLSYVILSTLSKSTKQEQIEEAQRHYDAIYALGATSQVILASAACISYSEEIFLCAEISIESAFFV